MSFFLQETRHMSRVTWLLISAVCAAPLFGNPGGTEPPLVGVFMEFESTPGDSSVQVMEREVERLLRPAGLALGWRLTTQNRGKESFAGLVVLKFRGKCRVEGWGEPVGDFGTLGETTTLAWARVAGGRVLPFGEVECDQVRKALVYVRAGSGKDERQKALGLALGRVVAHELYHILGRTTAHAAKGLARASQSMEDLVSSRDLNFEEDDSRVIEEELR